MRAANGLNFAITFQLDSVMLVRRLLDSAVLHTWAGDYQAVPYTV